MDELEISVLSAICSHKRLALDFSTSADENLFDSDEGRLLGKVFLNYIKTYKCQPTRKVMLDKHAEDKDLCCFLNNFYDKIDGTTYEESNYKYEMEKLKARYSKRRLEKARDRLNQGNLTNITATVRDIEKEIGAIKAINGQRAYDRLPIGNYFDTFKDNYIEKIKNPELGKGILTGYSFFDYIKNGLRPADLIILAGETGGGKALSINTPIPTPNGWTTMGEIKVGDYVLGDDGKPCKVITTSGIMYNRKCYEIEFSDGEKIIADANHEWKTSSFIERQKNTYSYKTTEEINDTLRLFNRKDKRLNHSVQNHNGLYLQNINLNIDPYVLGCWLGDVTSLDGAITSKVKLKQYNLIGNKHIPNQYLRASYEDRLSLLQGLMDTDGFISNNGNCEFTTTSELLKDGFIELLNTFGIINNYTKSKATLHGRVTSDRYRILFTTSLPIFNLTRKKEKLPKNIRFNHRFIKNVKQIKSVPVQCIKVDNESHMFLCGKSMIPTHNSMFLNNMAIQMYMQNNRVNMDPSEYTKGYNVTYFSLEMPYEDCFRRTLARMADVQEYGIRDARLGKAEAKGISQTGKFIKNYPHTFEIVDVPRGFSTDQLEMMFEEIKADYIPDVVFIDYMGLMEDADSDSDDWLKLGKLAGKVHEFARAHSIPVVTAVQLNRIDPGQKKSENKAIGLHRIGRSSLIAHHATVIIQIETRPDEETHDDFIYHIIKNRHGQSNKSHNIWKNFNKCSIIDKPYDIETANSWQPGHDISIDISEIIGAITS